MKLLDRYILGKFLTTFFFAVVLIVSIICIIDLTENLEDFLGKQAPWEAVFFQYYLNFMPYLANMLSPLMAFIAAVFVTARMASHTEIVAMLSSGMSLRRILLPYFLGSVGVAIGIFYITGWLIPRANRERISFQNAYMEENSVFYGNNIHMKVGDDLYVYMGGYSSDVKVGTQFTLEKVNPEGMTSKLKSPRVTWDSTKQAWHMDRYQVREFDKDGKEKFWAAVNKDTVIQLTPHDLAQNGQQYSSLTLDELTEYIDRLKERGAENIEPYIVEKYKRYAYPFALIILTIIGVIVSSRKSREGPGFQIALGFLLAFIFIIMVLMSDNLANSGDMPPLIAVWLPMIVFSGIGVYMYRQVPK